MYSKKDNKESKKPEKSDAKKENKSSAPTQPPSTSSSNDAASNLYHNPANGERSFIMLKPDAVQRGLTGKIIERFEKITC